MANLDPNAWPLPSTTMLQLVPAGDARGDEFLDRETMAAFVESVRSGRFAVHEDWGAMVGRIDNAELEQKFLEWNRRSKLGPAAPVLHHRRLALFEAIRDIGSTGTIPGFGISVHNLSRAIGDLETWLEGKRQELAARGMVDEQLTRMLTLIPAGNLASILGVSESTLSRWRAENSGPRFAKLSARSYVYPAIATVEWLETLLAK